MQFPINLFFTNKNLASSKKQHIQRFNDCLLDLEVILFTTEDINSGSLLEIGIEFIIKESDVVGFAQNVWFLCLFEINIYNYMYMKLHCGSLSMYDLSLWLIWFNRMAELVVNVINIKTHDYSHSI